MPFEIMFVMLIGAIVSPFALAIQCLHENENTAKSSGSCIQLMSLGDPAIRFSYLQGSSRFSDLFDLQVNN